MARILAFDYGSKRVGIAVTDPMQIIVTPLCTLHSKDVESYLSDYLKTEEVESFVVGYPLSLDETETDATPLVQAFVNRLKKLYPEVPIHLQDESYTSQEAAQELIRAGIKKKKRQDKGMLDKMSAVIILNRYLGRS